MKAAHLVSGVIVVAILLAALPSPSAITGREPGDPPKTTTTNTLTTTTSSVHTIVTTTKVATTTKHSPSVPTTIQSSVPICVVQVGFVQQDGSTKWMGTGVTGALGCQNTAEYFTDVGGGTVALNHFIVNGTSTQTAP